MEIVISTSYQMKTTRIETTVEAKVKGTVALSDPSVPSEHQRVSSGSLFNLLILTKSGSTLWASKLGEVKAFDLSETEDFVLAYMTSAKGPGFISIMARVKEAHHYTTLLDYGAYREQLLEQAKEASIEIGQFLGYALETEYWGADC